MLWDTSIDRVVVDSICTYSIFNQNCDWLSAVKRLHSANDNPDGISCEWQMDTALGMVFAINPLECVKNSIFIAWLDAT